MENTMINAVKFIFNGIMLRFVDFTKEVEIAAPNFELALRGLLERFPRLAPVLLDGEGRVRRTHQMFLNGESMAPLYYRDAQARSELAIQPGDSVFVLTAVAGG
jgi:hypothetical protein